MSEDQLLWIAELPNMFTYSFLGKHSTLFPVRELSFEFWILEKVPPCVLIWHESVISPLQSNAIQPGGQIISTTLLIAHPPDFQTFRQLCIAFSLSMHF